MAKPYGKTPKRTATRSKSRKSTTVAATIYDIRSEDGSPLSMPDARQGYYQLAKTTEQHPTVRAKSIKVYVYYVDEKDRPVRLEKDEYDIYPYRSAADEHGA
jgi:hypothetical protein